ncbi:uncharacterized protein LOC116929746 [Daphnia magna]|uniref:uncharacterized protein LOC116929746 n=1 Tax=Daphnia magna TaxID=35525 RepID=UPI001E1BAE47|nr:uncharacterized protein LOC116929746 [Daphnia magna]
MNSMPKPAEFDKVARSIVAHFPIAKDSASTADKVVYSSWHDSNSNVGRLLNYVRDRRSENKNKGAVVRSYTKRTIEDSAETLVDIGLAEKERFMRENQVTAENKEKMLKFHRDTLDISRKWIAAKKPTLTDIVKRFPRFTTLKAAIDCDLLSAEGWQTEAFAQKWHKIEKNLAEEILRKHGDFLVPLEDLTLADAILSYEDPLFDLSMKYMH